MKELRAALLELHRAIVALEREDYERRTGAANAAEFLQLLVQDEGWAWLRPLSELIVQIDGGSGEEKLIVAQTRKLLKPDSVGTAFQQRYAWLMERSPDIVYAHGAAMKALKSA